MNERIRSIPTWYRGVKFDSRLEADWAATFDAWGWYWQREPDGIRLPSGECYLPDFHLPSQKVWCEVKGPHNERLSKAAELQQALLDEAGDQWEFGSYLVVILRPAGPGDTAQWEGSLPGQDVTVLECSEPDHHRTFMDYNGLWSCRLHLSTNREKYKPWQPDGALYRSGELKFARAPRRREGAA